MTIQARRRAGWRDGLMDARLSWLTGERYPAPPRSLSILFLNGLPGNNGSLDGCVVVGRADDVRYGEPQHPVNLSGFPHERNVTPVEPVAVKTFGEPWPDVMVSTQAWALVDGDTDRMLYVGTWPASLAQGVVTIVPAQTFAVHSEHPGQS